MSALVAQNQTLTRENSELRSLLDGITQSVQRLGARPGRPRGRAAASTGGRPAAAKRTRRKITDPATLERRRAALAKARKVLAAKRAAAKRGQ